MSRTGILLPTYSSEGTGSNSASSMKIRPSKRSGRSLIAVERLACDLISFHPCVCPCCPPCLRYPIFVFGREPARPIDWIVQKVLKRSGKLCAEGFRSTIEKLRGKLRWLFPAIMGIDEYLFACSGVSLQIEQKRLGGWHSPKAQDKLRCIMFAELFVAQERIVAGNYRVILIANSPAHLRERIGQDGVAGFVTDLE